MAATAPTSSPAVANNFSTKVIVNKTRLQNLVASKNIILHTGKDLADDVQWNTAVVTVGFDSLFANKTELWARYNVGSTVDGQLDGAIDHHMATNRNFCNRLSDWY